MACVASEGEVRKGKRQQNWAGMRVPVGLTASGWWSLAWALCIMRRGVDTKTQACFRLPARIEWGIPLRQAEPGRKCQLLSIHHGERQLRAAASGDFHNPGWPKLLLRSPGILAVFQLPAFPMKTRFLDSLCGTQGELPVSWETWVMTVPHVCACCYESLPSDGFGWPHV